MPKSLLSAEASVNIHPSDDGEDAFYEVPAVGNWFREEEGVLKANIKNEFSEFINEYHQRAKACGKNVKVNDTILSVEEYLFLKRKDNPYLTIDAAKAMIKEDYQDRIDQTLDVVVDQVYNQILDLHFSDYTSVYGTWALLSNVNNNRGLQACDDNLGEFCYKTYWTYGKPLGSYGLEKIKQVIFWLAAYKAEEVKMYDELYTCLDKKASDNQQSMSNFGIHDQTIQASIDAMEGSSAKSNSNLSECLVGNGEGGEDSSGGVSGSITGGNNGALAPPGGSNQGLVNQDGANLNENRPQGAPGVGAQGNGVNTDNPSANVSGVTQSQNPSGTSSSSSTQGKGATTTGSGGASGTSTAKKASELKKKLLKHGKKVNERTKALQEKVANSGYTPPPALSSGTLQNNAFSTSPPKLAALGAVNSSGGKKDTNKRKRRRKKSKEKEKGVPAFNFDFNKKRKRRGSFGSSSGGPKVSAKQAKANKKMLNFIKKNKKLYESSDQDSLFKRVSKAMVRNGYPIFFVTFPTDGKGSKGLPSLKQQEALELSPEQEGAMKEMEMLKRLNKK